MIALILLQVVFNLLFLVGFFVFWMKLKKPPKDDPRLSRGLQLLQSKISILEDLSDRTEVQVKQLSRLLESKCHEVQLKMQKAEGLIRQIDQSMHKSIEVAEIFQDKIPHEDIIERQNTIKYVQAARLAHQGKSIEEIIEEVGLPQSEVEFIAKVNKEELVFDENQLPAWVSQLQQEGAPAKAQDDYSRAFDPPQEDYASLEELGKKFRETCMDFEEKDRNLNKTIDKIEQTPVQFIGAVKNMTNTITTKIKGTAEQVMSEGPTEVTETGSVVEAPDVETKKIEAKTISAKPLEFSKVDVNKNLS